MFWERERQVVVRWVTGNMAAVVREKRVVLVNEQIDAEMTYSHSISRWLGLKSISGRRRAHPVWLCNCVPPAVTVLTACCQTADSTQNITFNKTIYRHHVWPSGRLVLAKPFTKHSLTYFQSWTPVIKSTLTTVTDEDRKPEIKNTHLIFSNEELKFWVSKYISFLLKL